VESYNESDSNIRTFKFKKRECCTQNAPKGFALNSLQIGFTDSTCELNLKRTLNSSLAMNDDTPNNEIRIEQS
jgi:hypothetical protein